MHLDLIHIRMCFISSIEMMTATCHSMNKLEEISFFRIRTWMIGDCHILFLNEHPSARKAHMILTSRKTMSSRNTSVLFFHLISQLNMKYSFIFLSLTFFDRLLMVLCLCSPSVDVFLVFLESILRLQL